MMQAQLLVMAGTVVFVVGVVAALVIRDVIRRLIAVNIGSSGVMLILVGLASRGDQASPDPIPQALVLTGIVVMAAITGLALTLARRIEVPETENEVVEKDAGALRSGWPPGEEPDR